MKKLLRIASKFLIVAVPALLVVIFVIVPITGQYVLAGNGQPPRGHNQKTPDPCVALNNCGPGDHGRGNPTKAVPNCNALGGEPDVCKQKGGGQPGAEPSATPKSEKPPSGSPSATPVKPPSFNPSETPVPESNPGGHSATVTPTPTLVVMGGNPPVVQCASCPISKEYTQLLVGSTYIADLLNTQSSTSNLKMTITIFDGVMGKQIGDPILMEVSAQSNQPLHVYRVLKCDDTQGKYLHIVATANSAGNVWFALDEWIEWQH